MDKEEIQADEGRYNVVSVASALSRVLGEERGRYRLV
jgi:hypothetical protein